MPEISKAYEPQSVEEKWYDFWLREKCFVADPKRVSAKRPAYSIVIPPPNVTGVLTMGHVLNNTIQDILARKARMDGKEVLWLPGTDHAGIATQTAVEKALKKQGVIRHRDDLGREKFLEHVWAWKEEHGGIIIQQLKKLGASCDWTRERFTMDPEYSRCVQKVFVELYKKGLIYRGKRMVNWDPAARTALSDEEVNMVEEKGHLWHIKYPVLDDQGRPKAQEAVVVATTRPETMLGDEAVAVNPTDPRYTQLVGKKVLLPLRNKPIPVIADELVDPKFGTGCVKVTPAHDPADYQIALRHKLPLTAVIGPNGAMTQEAGDGFAGLDRMEARKSVLEHLERQGLIVKVEDYVHNVGYSERSNVPIEPYLSEQWFLKYPSVEESTRGVELGAIADKRVSVVRVAGGEMAGADRGELRESAMKLAREQGWIGKSFPNEDTGWKILVRRKSLSHAFNNRNRVVIQAVAVLPELIRTGILWRSEAHQPPDPRFKQVHHFLGALEVAGELYCVPMTVKELADGRMLYDYKAKKAAFGGKPLVAHLPEEKLGIQPAPNAAEVNIATLLAAVNLADANLIRFHPDRWAKTYTHWMRNIKDWCISRQLWWGHRIPVWTKRVLENEFAALKLSAGIQTLLSYGFAEAGDKSNVTTDACICGNAEETTIFRLGLDGQGTVTVNAATCYQNEQDALVIAGFTQDPDVLDTWFSSWLWPFATMGWTGDKAQDSKAPTLQAFYPTTDLVTGPDIIFFWVARMIMAGYQFMGDLPFRNVCFTGIIRDKQGRKMSKSLGNSPDPLDLINKYGADALRFGTMRSAPLGQDILFDEQNVELGRNFCNKLWNACRFRQMAGQASSLSSVASNKLDAETGKMPVPLSEVHEVQGEINPALLTSDDKWILLKLDQAIRQIDAALAEYKFSDATATLYRFFWSEYCDWYVEASKAVLTSRSRGNETLTEKSETGNQKSEIDQSLLTSAATNPEQRANTLAVIDFVLSHTLRLFHPFLPFITEELWHDMGYAEDMPENQGGKTIMTAPWPKPLDGDFKAHYRLSELDARHVEARNELVTQGRNLRRTANIQASKKVKYIFKPTRDLIPHDVEVLGLLLNAEALEVRADYQPKKGTPTVRNELGDLYLPLEGLIDVEAEKARLRKELEKAETEIAKVEQKLNNPAFTQKVPANVLAEHQKRQAEWHAKKQHILSALTSLEG